MAPTPAPPCRRPCPARCCCAWPRTTTAAALGSTAKPWSSASGLTGRLPKASATCAPTCTACAACCPIGVAPTRWSPSARVCAWPCRPTWPCLRRRPRAPTPPACWPTPPFTGCRATGCRALPSSAPGPTTPAATGNPSGARPAHPRWSRPRVTRQPTSARPCWRPGSRPAVPITRPAMPNPDTSPWTTTSCCPGAVTTRRGCAATARLWWSCWASRASARPACSPAPGPLHRCSRAARGWRACPLRLCWSGCANTRLGWTPPCAPRRPRWAPTAWIWRGCCRKSRATKPCRHWTLKPPRPACSRPWHGSSRAAARCCWSMTCSGSIWPPSNGWCC